MSEPTQEQLDEASRRIHGTIQDCITDGLISGAMLTDWYLVGQWMDDEGETGSILISPENATAQRSLGLVHLASIVLDEEVRAWIRGEDE